MNSIISVRHIEDDPFLHGYLQCALWSAFVNDGDPLDTSLSRVNQSSIRMAMADCAQFEEGMHRIVARLLGPEICVDYDVAGHLFWCARNGRGDGFEDGDWGEAGEELQELAGEFGECNVSVSKTGSVSLGKP